MASKLALLANLACLSTISLKSLLKPISSKDLLSNEVKTVTPINFVLPETFLAALSASRPEFM